MLPPQAPPAQVSPQEAAAAAALRRLADHQAWLLAQRDAMPLPPDAPVATMEAGYLAAFDAAMAAPTDAGPGVAATPRTQAMAYVLAAIMKDEAALRRLDGTLDEEAANGIRQWLASNGAATDVHASWLRFGGTRYAGGLVLQPAPGHGAAWLFLPGSGWEAFPSLPRLHGAIATRFREHLAQVDALPGMADEAMREAVEGGIVDTVPATGDILADMAADIVRVQRDKASAAWQLFADGLLSGTGLADELHAARAWHTVVDITGMLARRDQLLFAQVQRERLASVPPEVATAWRTAFDGYREQVSALDHSAREGSDPFPMSLEAFARDALQQRLQARGLTEAVDDIEVRVRDLAPPSSILGYLWQRDRAASQPMGLLELAYANAGHASIQAQRRGGGALSAPLASNAVASMVRALNLHERYPAYLDAHAATAGSQRAQRLAQATLRFAAEDARTSYYIASEPRSFIDDRDERGYRMVEAVLTSPAAAGRPLVGGHAIVAHQLTYKDAVVADIVVFGVANPASAPRIVAWTPGAPDGKDIREFESRAQMAREFLHAREFESYLLARLPLDVAVTDSHGNPRFDTRGSRLATWVFNQGSLDGTRTDEVFAERTVTGDVFATIEATQRHLLARNARWLTRSTADLDQRHVLGTVQLVASALHPGGDVAASVAEDVARAIPRMAQNAWRFYDAVKAGDDTDAFFAFVDGYKAFLTVAPNPALRGAGTQSAWLRATRGPSRVVPGGARAVAADTVFETRFAAAGVRPSDAGLVADGVHHVAGQRYIAHAGAMYRVRFDPDIGGWRLIQPGAPSSSYGPAIERVAGGWAYRRDVGLLGGSGRSHGGRPPIRYARPAHRASSHLRPGPQPRPPTELVTLMRDPTLYNPDLTTLTARQLRTFWSELRIRTGGDAAQILRAMRSRDPQASLALSGSQRGHWAEALRIARSRPSVPAPVAAGPSTSAAGAGPLDLTVRRTDGMHRLPQAEWPAELWYYAENTDARLLTVAEVQLNQQRLGDQVIGVPLVRYPPGTPIAQAHPSWQGLASDGATLEQRLTQVRVDMRRLRDRLTPAGRPAYELYRVGGGEHAAYVVRPTATARDPQGTRSVALIPGDFWLGLPRP
jgi:hypothetical protein